MKLNLFRYVYRFPNGLESETWLNPAHIEAITKKQSYYTVHMQSGKQFSLTMKDIKNFFNMLGAEEKNKFNKKNGL